MNNPCATQDQDLSQATCQHHWQIEAPDGPTSRGRCLKCGAEKEFRNIIDVADGWGGSRKEPSSDVDTGDVPDTAEEDYSDSDA